PLSLPIDPNDISPNKLLTAPRHPYYIAFKQINPFLLSDESGKVAPTAVHEVKMGIKGLGTIIKEHAPDAIKEGEIKNHFGRKVAIVRINHLHRPTTTHSAFVPEANSSRL